MDRTHPVHTLPVQKHRGEPDTRDRHTNHTKPNPLKTTSMLKTNPPTDSRARPQPNPGTHASPQTAPLTRSSAVVVMEMRERRGREPDGIALAHFTGMLSPTSQESADILSDL